MADELQRITALLVDDEENILKALLRLLLDEDFDIETATLKWRRLLRQVYKQ